MNIINNFSDLYNHFINIYNEIINISDKVHISQISQLIKEKLMFLGQKSLESIFSNKIGTGYTEKQIENKDDGLIYNYYRLVPKTYISLFGPITINRAYYYNKEKKIGFYPIEKNNSFLKDVCLPEVKELICYTSAIEPYAQTKEILNNLSGINVSEFEIQKVTKRIGNKLVLKEDDSMLHLPKNEEPKKKIEKMVISMDGAMINTFEGWKEVKSGVIYEFGKESTKAKNKTYISRIEDCDNFSKRIKYEARRRNYLKAKDLIVIGDGARWIWDIAEKEFSTAQNIVDWYHAKKHLCRICDLLYLNNIDKKKEMEEKLEKELYNGDIDKFIDIIDENKIDSDILSRVDDLISLQTEIDYFLKNRNKMQYKYFEEKGYPIGSGIIEAACKQLVQIRVKRNGMKWKKEGSHAILQLRCHYLGKRWIEVRQAIWEDTA